MGQRKGCPLCKLELTELEAEKLDAWINRFDAFCVHMESRFEALQRQIDDLRNHNESL